jgi:actin-related protein 8
MMIENMNELVVMEEDVHTSSANGTNGGSTSSSSPIQQPQQQQATTVIIHIGSKQIRFGTHEDWVGPQFMDNCIGIPITQQKPKKSKKKVKQENIRNKELLRIRGQLLVNRKLISEKTADKDVYFEEIGIKEEFPAQQQNQLLQLQRKQTSEESEYIRGALFGKRAIDKVIENDPNDRYELFYPFWKGRFNTGTSSHHTAETITKNCDFIRAILQHILKERLKLTDEVIRESKCVLILPDECLESGKGVEMHHLLDIVFNKIQFNQVLLHKESVSAAFGAGVPTEVCVVDLGESKTTLSIIEDGEAVSRSELPYGGVHVSKTLLWILKQCNFPLSNSVSFDSIADQQIIEQIRNDYCHLEEGNELFQTVDFTHNNKIYKMDIGDPLLIAPLGYFHPKLFGRECKLSEKAGEEDPYDQISSVIFWTEETYNSIRSQTATAAVAEPPAKKQRLDETGKSKGKQKKQTKKGGKKRKKSSGSDKTSTSKSASKETEEDDTTQKKNTLKTALAIDRAIIRLIKSSGMNIESKVNKKKAITVTILLIGGLSKLRGLKTYLESRLTQHYTSKNEGKQVKVNVLTNDRDRNMDVRFMSWNGGLIMSHVEPSKRLWINREDYQNHGDRYVIEKCAFLT